MTTTTTSSRTAADTPFSVQGFVTDPKLVGYQILTNYESTYWACLVGNDAWRLYEVFRSHCHERNNVCYPSIQLLTTILGLKEKRVLTGWSKTIKGKEYRYPGLIEVLQEHKLIIAEVQGEGPQIHYLFHVNLTPGLLSEEQLARLPALLQKKHAELIDRCQQEQRALEAKRRPSKFKNSNENSSDDTTAQGAVIYQGGAVIYQGGGGNLPPEQYQYNNTHKTASRTPGDQRNNNSGGSATEKSVVVAFSSQKIVSTERNRDAESQNETGNATEDPPVQASALPNENSLSAAQQANAATLIAIGLAETVAYRLAGRYSQARIEAKIEYLTFLQTEQPEKVQNPRGWLRRAIEENYGAPDGFISNAEWAHREAEQAHIEQAELAHAQATALAHQQEQSEKAARAQAYRAWLNHTYGTAESELVFWEQALPALKLALYPHKDVFQRYIEPVEILKITEEEVCLGFTNERLANHPTHPGTKKLIERTLSAVAGRKVQVRYEVIQAVEALG